MIDCLKCLFKQKYKNFEVIIVDQSDKEFKEKEKFIKSNRNKFILIRGNFRSASRARNLGLKKAKGEIIIFLDDDVVFGKDFIAKHVKAFADDKTGAIAGRVISEGQMVEPDRKNSGQITPWGSFTDGFSSQIKQEVMTVITCNASWRKSVLNKFGGFDENFTGPIREDTDLSLRTLKAGYKIIFEPKAEVIHKRAPSGGFRKSEGRARWYKGFFKSEMYFSLKWIKWYWWPIFWGTRWQWFIRSKSLRLPWQGMKEGILSYQRWQNKLQKTKSLLYSPQINLGRQACFLTRSNYSRVSKKRIGVDAGSLAEAQKTGVSRLSVNLLRQLKKIDKKNQYLIFDKPKRGWRYFWLPLLVYLNKVDVFLGLNQALPVFLPCPSVVMVYDLAFEYFPESFADHGGRLKRITRHAVQKADKIIVLSQSTKKDLIKKYQITPKKIRVIYETADIK